MPKTEEQKHLDKLEDILNKEHIRLTNHLQRVKDLLAKVRGGQKVELKTVDHPSEIMMKE